MELSIIIPAFNEEERIAPTLLTLDAFLAKQRIHYEIIVVDDGSSDNTVILVEAMGVKMTALRCIPSKRNRGKGHAVRVGMLAAKGEVRVMYDADGSMPATELPKLITPIFSRGDSAEGAKHSRSAKQGVLKNDANSSGTSFLNTDIAIGSRYTGNADTQAAQPGWRVAWSRVANRIVQRSLVAGIRDTQCGFKAFSAEAAEAVFSRATIDGWAFDLEVLALASKLGYSIGEVGVVWSDDERSHISPVRDFLKVACEFATIRWNFKTGVYSI